MNEQSRKVNSIRNAAYGLVVTFLSVLISFANRTFFVKYLGIEPLGLNGLFTEVISMMSLAELGVGMAIIYSLYRPIHDQDYSKINQLMSLFKTTYNSIAGILLIIGFILLPFIHLIVNGTGFDNNYIRIVFFLFVVNSAASYLFSYNTSFINANQKQYVVSLVTTVGKLIFTIINIVFLVAFGNYILYLVLLIMQTVLTNLFLARYVKRKYPFITYNDKLPKDERNKIFKDIKNIFIKRVSGVATSSSTNILISLFVNTIQVGLYSNYIMLFSIARTLKAQFSNAVKASIGDLSVSESAERCIDILYQLTYMFFVFGMCVCVVLSSVGSTFITLWLGEEYLLHNVVVIIAVYNLFLEIYTEPLWQYLEVSGLFKQDKYIGIIGTSVNLLVAISLGYKFGIIGILLGTISTQCVQMILKTILLYKYKFNSSYKKYLIYLLKMSFVYVVSIIIVILINEHIGSQNPILNFVFKTILACIIAITVSFVSFFKSKEQLAVFNYANGVLKRKI